MANQTSPKQNKLFGINWLTLIFFIVIAFVFLQKDLSLNFNLNAPLEVEQERTRQPKRSESPSHLPTDKRKKKEKITDASPLREETKKGTSLFNFFENPFAGGKKTMDLKSALDKISNEEKEAYLKRFAHVATNEKEKFGIPASIILANGMLQSCAGKNGLAQGTNNHFAIPCTNDWTGDKAEVTGKCYRGYETAWTSYRDHSTYLNTDKFAHLKDLKTTDYQGWAKGLEKAKYPNATNLRRNLIRIIEQYGLDDLDK